MAVRWAEAVNPPARNSIMTFMQPTRPVVLIITGVVICLSLNSSRSNVTNQLQKEVLDSEQLIGVWQVISAENGDWKAKEEDIASLRLAFTGKEYLTASPAEILAGEYTIDSSKKPKQIDFCSYDGPNKGKKGECIYVLV
jgi:uncharacterized protein (TIGR03067 family)